ncbi:MAG: hypothetical protein D6681_13710 [Calditrichaeota bacterium]|nr:MAG: hypothetical protein D6681_13710 [Calditrichota bacterium]
MQFKDAAYHILQQAGEPLHYNEITERALAAGILTTTGQTPHATMGALLYTDTLKPNSRFRRGDQKGTFALKTEKPDDIETQIKAIDSQVRKTLRKRLLTMHPRQFENLIQTLLDAMGLEETSVTTYGNDGGIDLRGVLNAENLSRINIAVQAKRWKNNVGAKTVRELRGSLKVHEQGIVITPSGFTAKAQEEAAESGKTHISLIDGIQLVDLLIRYQVGAKLESYPVPRLDEDFWSEILESEENDAHPVKKPLPKAAAPKVTFPLPIYAIYKGQTYRAELLNLEGQVRLGEHIFNTPSAAAKTIATTWKQVNGWTFWRFDDPETGQSRKISDLRI